MPVYFGPIAPHCPVSRDSPIGREQAPIIRTAVPRAYDLASAIAAVNILRSIVTQLVFDKVINNTYTPPPPRFSDKRKTSRWTQNKPTKKKYKYYLKDDNGKEDKDVWVMTERIENISWTDKSWKTTLPFIYGDKEDDGHPVGSSAPISEADLEG